MLDSIPQTAWIRLIDYLGFYDTCKLRIINKDLRDKIDEDIFYIYKLFEGKRNDKISNYLDVDHQFSYPKLDLNRETDSLHNYKNVAMTFQIMLYFELLNYIDSNNLINNRLHRARIDEVHISKLIKAIKLIKYGLSTHYTIKCIALPHTRIDWAIEFKSQNMCDIFCFRGAVELSEAQKNNLLRVQRHTFQDTFAFRAVEELNDAQIDFVIEKKREGMLDYNAIEAAKIEVK